MRNYIEQKMKDAKPIPTQAPPVQQQEQEEDEEEEQTTGESITVKHKYNKKMKNII